jgi:hypothetical protein
LWLLLTLRLRLVLGLGLFDVHRVNGGGRRVLYRVCVCICVSVSDFLFLFESVLERALRITLSHLDIAINPRNLPTILEHVGALSHLGHERNQRRSITQVCEEDSVNGKPAREVGGGRERLRLGLCVGVVLVLVLVLVFVAGTLSSSRTRCAVRAAKNEGGDGANPMKR